MIDDRTWTPHRRAVLRWTTWHGVRGTKANPVDGEHRLYGFLTTTANGIVGPVHPKAMPVMLTTAEEYNACGRHGASCVAATPTARHDHVGQTRRQLFEAIERPALRPLPAEPYV